MASTGEEWCLKGTKEATSEGSDGTNVIWIQDARRQCATAMPFASACTATQPAKGDEDVKMSDSVSKGSEEPTSRSKSSEDDPMDGGSKEPPSDKRESSKFQLATVSGVKLCDLHLISEMRFFAAFKSPKPTHN